MTSFRPGATFRATDPRIERHLWVVLCEPDAGGNVAIVSFTSYRSGKDPSCVVEASEHEWLTHRSCVAYWEAKVVNVSHLQAAVASRTIRFDSAVSMQLLGRMIDGAAATNFLPEKVGDLLKALRLL